MKVFVFEPASVHHNTFSTLVTIFSDIFTGSVVWPMATEEVWRKTGEGVKGLSIRTLNYDLHGKPRWYKALKISQRVLNDVRLALKLPSLLGIEKGDIFVFSTLELWLHYYPIASAVLMENLKKIGVSVFGVVHNSFFLFDSKELSPEDYSLVVDHLSRFRRYDLLRLWWVKRRWLPRFREYIDGIFTLGDIYVPVRFSDMRLTIIDRFYNSKCEKKNHGVFTIVVPGGVLESRRDYRLIADSIGALREDVEVVLLGKLYDEHVLDYFTNNDRVRVVFFPEFVGEKEYTYWLKRAHLVIAPVKNQYYGKFTVTGAVGDAVSCGLPIACPWFYTAFDKCLRYRDVRELTDIIRQVRYSSIDVDYREYDRQVLARSVERFIRERMR